MYTVYAADGSTVHCTVYKSTVQCARDGTIDGSIVYCTVDGSIVHCTRDGYFVHCKIYCSIVHCTVNGSIVH